METDIGELGCSERKRKRKRLSSNRPKLLFNDKVEVRSLEDGFRGSWHSATVIACENQARKVQFDHLLCDDGSQRLIECIQVPLTFDGIHGIIPSNRKLCSYRGLIRPLPPSLDFKNWSLHYGQCVDVYYQEAWWEGVIFDHEDGSEDRTIFFPDMGDEMQFGIDRLRITQDWDEYSEDWKPRGNWLFLELVEEFEREWPLQVSVRQIWYEVRAKKGFKKIKEWTSTAKGNWKKLVWEVILDNSKLTVNHFFQELDLSSDSGNSLAVIAVKNGGMDSSLLPIDLPAVEEINLDGLTSIKENERSDMNLSPSSSKPCHEKAQCVPPHAPSVLPFNPDEFSMMHSNLNDKGGCSPSFISSGKLKRRWEKKCDRWLPAGPDIVPSFKFCPDAVSKHEDACNSGQRLSRSLKIDLRKHLAYLGWKIEFLRDGSALRMRYTSPDGKSYFSLVQVCKALRETEFEVLSPASESESEKETSASVSGSEFSSPLTDHEDGSDTVIEPEHCPQAVVDYYLLGSVEENDDWKCYRKPNAKILQFKAKKHLCADGWLFWYTMRGGGRRELRYTSPRGRSYNSLRTACKAYLEEGAAGDSEKLTLALTDPQGRDNLISRYELSEGLIEPSGSPLSKELVEIGMEKVKREGELPRKRMNGVQPLVSHLLQSKVASRILKKRKVSKSLTKLRDYLNGDCPTRVLRSSKRARQVVVPSSAHQNPRTVLSLLIDNNVVLPRAKVRYLNKKDHRTMAEGRVTRDGIKCNCCHIVFTLSKFEAHAGSTNHRPSANIFLEDGRSLLDCQSQLNNSKRNLITEPQEAKGRPDDSTNDYICSVCHFGGELVLCDHCPSSFHTNCLGLKDVPDGDWFCPSCCCGICGRRRFNNDEEQFTDDSVLSCHQCEHQYHVGCLRERGLTKVDSYPEGNWFCNERCEQIFFGLRKLLGKPVPVGEDNLTWTLLKHVNDDGDRNGSDIDALTENYCKLNVALSVMHECFEPVKESLTGRDLVEDVIFNRRSKLNRLNFQGFYTVLLERNDELITAATIRVHGEKVAEVPLVGTRFRYRRLGMCRILMNELEKKLLELGVERLVLPAVPNVLNTWTTSFGFSKMTALERLNFLNYTFLDFQGTVMCQKFLKKIPSTDSILLTRTQNIREVVSGIGNMVLDGISSISEAFQTDEVDASEIVDQGSADIAGVDGSNGSDGTAPPGFASGICLDCSFDGTGHKECEKNDSSFFKCYKRRKISACGS